MKRRRTARSHGRHRHTSADRPAAPDPLPAFDRWLALRRRWVLLVVVVASLGVRGVYFVQVSASPVINLQRWDQTDMNYFDAWGRQIARGDWLSASMSPPLHDWHRQIADAYLATHPDERARLAAQASPPDASTDVDALLWAGWTGGHRFYQDPLYPYLVALTYRLVGDDVRFVFAWQLLAGVLSNVLIWLLARRFFGDTVAACAAALAVLCGPLVYYELLLLRETTIVFIGLASIWLADRAMTTGRWNWFATLGVSLGLAFLLKSNLLLLTVGVSLGMAIQFRHRWRQLRAPAVAMAAGFALVLTPLVARNRSLHLPPLALASAGGLDFIISNDIASDPALGFSFDVSRVADLMGESGGALIPAVKATLHRHTIASYVKMLGQKWQQAWYWFEIPNNANFYYWRLRAPLLGWLPVTFWLCGPLALVGLVIGARRFAHVWLLYLLVIGSLAPLLVFYVLSRFRLPLVAAVMPFAALTLVELARWMSRRRYTPLLIATAALLVVGSWTSRPLQGQPLVRPSDWLIPFTVQYEPQVRDALDANDAAGAATAYLAFFQYEPDRRQQASTNRDLAVLLAGMHADCAEYLRAAGQPGASEAQLDQAGVWLQTVLTADPGNVSAHRLLADVRFRRQAFEDAAAHYEAYLRVQPNDATALARLGVSLARTHRPDQALLALRRAVDLDARNGEAQQGLATVLLDDGVVDEAAAHAQLGVALSADDPAAHVVLGRAWAIQGRLDAAAAQFEEALRIDPANREAREHLAATTR